MYVCKLHLRIPPRVLHFNKSIEHVCTTEVDAHAHTPEVVGPRGWHYRGDARTVCGCMCAAGLRDISGLSSAK